MRRKRGASRLLEELMSISDAESRAKALEAFCSLGKNDDRKAESNHNLPVDGAKKRSI